MNSNRVSNGDSEKRVRRLETLSWWMDEAFEIPFLKWRIGLDALFGFVPGLGDLVGAVISGVVLWEALSLKVSTWVVAQMGMNVLVEYLIGMIPVLGDLFDIHFRANRRNVDLLKAGLQMPATQTARSRGALMLLGSVLLLMIFAMMAATVWILATLWNWLAGVDVGQIVLQLRNALSNIF